MIAAVLAAVAANASGDAPLVAALSRAAAQTLHAEPQWRALLHYETGLITRRQRSHIESDSFFFAPDGARDPHAELVATLRAFADPDARVREDQHPQCAYPARRKWLFDRLEIDSRDWPAPDCAPYARWRKGLAARQLSLIFPEGFMNNPASMFGHTLMRLDTGGEPGAEDLLAYAVDFTGDTSGDPMIVYLAKGLMGLYPGYFGVNPYYEQLERYADWENRDVWEYRLTLEPEELERVLMHLWELRAIAFPYYFFDENCSYHLLKLMEAGRPEIRLSDGFPLVVIPADTVRAVAEVPGLVESVRYRPAPATELKYALRALSRGEKRLVRALAEGSMAPDAAELTALPDEERARLLTIASKLLKYEFLAGRIPQEEARKHGRALLVARSRIPTSPEADDDLPTVPEPAVRPDQAHGSAMVSLVGGVENNEGYLELRFRPSLHDLIDPAGGYTKHMQIDFLDTRVRYYPEHDRVRLQELVLVQALSLSPRDEVFRPFAWKLDTGLRTRFSPELGRLRELPVWRTNVAAGMSIEPGGHFLLYGLGELTLDLGPDLDPVVSFGPGVRVGLMTSLYEDRYAAHVFGTVTRLALGDTETFFEAGLVQRLTLQRNLTAELETTWSRAGGLDWLRLAGSLKLFF